MVYRPDPEIPKRPQASLCGVLLFLVFVVLFTIPEVLGAPPIWMWPIGTLASAALALLMAYEYGYRHRERDEWDATYGPKKEDKGAP